MEDWLEDIILHVGANLFAQTCVWRNNY